MRPSATILDAKAVDAEVAHPANQPVEPFGQRVRGARCERLVGRRARAFCKRAKQLVVLVGVTDRIELEDARVGSAAELREESW